MIKIYFLIDPFTKEVRYVGQTVKKLNFRLTKHLADSGKNKRKSNWLKKIIRNGKRPEIKLIKECSNRKRADFCESFYIKIFGRLDLGNGILYNLTDGGQGASNLIFSEQSRRNKSLAMTGKKQSAELIEKRISKIRGRKQSDQEKALRSSIQKNKFLSGNLIIPSTKGTKLSNEHIALIIKRNTGRAKTQKELDALSKANSKGKIYQVDKNGNIVKIHDSIRRASIIDGFCYPRVHKSCKSKGKNKHKGYSFIKESDFK